MKKKNSQASTADHDIQAADHGRRETPDAIDDFDMRMHFSDCYFQVPGKPFENIRLIEKRYECENEFMRAVSAANEEKAVEYYEKLQRTLMPFRLKDKLRDRKDLCITLNTLLRKATEARGIHPIHIDAYSNENIKELEKLTNLEQCYAFSLKIIHGYCKMMKDFDLDTYSLPIRRAITYIRTDLAADLNLSTLAEMLNVTPSYLSSLFKKEIGIPLTEYVNRCRIKQAKLLLGGTNLPIKTIAIQCGFSDLNYFTRVFKRIAGTTPKSFRMEIIQTGQFPIMKKAQKNEQSSGL